MADEYGTGGVESTDDGGFDGGQGFDSGTDAGGNVEASNPWDWAADLDPSEVQKTYTKFTQKTQNLSAKEREVERMRDELAPLSRLRDSLESDPGLVAAIENYFATGKTPEDEIGEVRSELNNVKTTLQIEKELANLDRWVTENDLPEFDEQELLAHAAENKILNLKAAYKDMTYDKVQDRKADKLVNDIKRGRGAALPKAGKSDNVSKPRFSEEDIANMTDDEFKENFADIYSSF